MALCDEGDERKPAAEGRPLRVKEFVGGKNNGFPFCFRHRTALLRSWELLSYPGAQKRNAPSPSDMGRVTFMISRHGQSDISDLTFSMGYPVRSTGYMFCYNRSMIHLASGFFRRFFRPRGGRFRLDAGQLLYYGVLTIHEQGQTRCCRAEIRPYCVDPLDHTESMLCGSFLVWLHFCSGKTARPLPTMDLRVIFVF